MSLNDTVEPAATGSGSAEHSDDLALLQLVVGGDRDAFRSLYDRYYQPLFRFIYRITRRTDLAEEGAADAMLVVWQKAKSFQRRSRVSTWIMGIGYRKGLKLAEQSKRQAERFQSMESDRIDELSTGHSEHMDTATLQDWLDVGMRRLSGEQRAVVELTYFKRAVVELTYFKRAVVELTYFKRAVVELTYFNGYSYAEIAGILSCPVNTVKTRMFHARARLRQILPELSATPGSRLREDAP